MAGFFAAVQFTARGGRVECLLDWCVAQGIPVQRVCPNAEGVTAWLPARYYRRLHRPARPEGPSACATAPEGTIGPSCGAPESAPHTAGPGDAAFGNSGPEARR